MSLSEKCQQFTSYTTILFYLIQRPLTSLTAWRSRGTNTSNTCPTPAGFPGKFTIIVSPQIPAVPRERAASGWIAAHWAVTNVMSPGASFSITSCVASGVISRGENPVPPVVKIISHVGPPSCFPHH
mmetsp:Transcript_2679/g.4112  ORF Transcript_2679/g.4112 Transcript_2679/m.4112 type:complete len:127 (+) Transcript_2679:118-498(+)